MYVHEHDIEMEGPYERQVSDYDDGYYFLILSSYAISYAVSCAPIMMLIMIYIFIICIDVLLFVDVASCP